MKTNLQESLRKIIQQEIAAVLREDSSQFKVGEFVKYTNPASDKKFKKDISFWTNTPKNKNKPFEVYIKDGAIGEIVKVNGDIATVKFSPKWFVANSVNTNIPYEIFTGYLEPVKMTSSSVSSPYTGKLDYSESVNEVLQEAFLPKKNVMYAFTEKEDGKLVTTYVKYVGEHHGSTPARPEWGVTKTYQFRMYDKKTGKPSKDMTGIFVKPSKFTPERFKEVPVKKSSVNEGPEELGAYRRLVITSPKSKEMKAEFTKFMSRPEIKSQYPGIAMKIIDSPKPETIVVDVNGDKATVIGIKLGDIVKRVDSKAKVIVRKERKLK